MQNGETKQRRRTERAGGPALRAAWIEKTSNTSTGNATVLAFDIFSIHRAGPKGPASTGSFVSRDAPPLRSSPFLRFLRFSLRFLRPLRYLATANRSVSAAIP